MSDFRVMLNLLTSMGPEFKEANFLPGLEDVVMAASNGEISCTFTMYSEKTEDVVFDSIGARKTIEEYKLLNLESSYEECYLAEYKIGDEIMRKFLLNIKWGNS